MSSDSEDLEIELEDDHFHFLMSNLLAHDPIHDFNKTKPFLKEEGKEIYPNLLELYNLINKYDLNPVHPDSEKKYGGADDEILAPPPANSSDRVIDIARVKILIEENSIIILYLIGFLSEEKINELKRNEIDRNLIYLLINEALETVLGFTPQGSSTQSGGMPPSMNQNQRLLNSGFIDNKRPGEKLDSNKRYTFSLTGETMGLGAAKEFLNKRAATKIQSNQRTRKAKQELLNRKTRKAAAEKAAAEKTAATKLQSLARTRKAKRELLNTKTRKAEAAEAAELEAKVAEAAKASQKEKSKGKEKMKPDAGPSEEAPAEAAEKPKTKKEIEDEIIRLMIDDKLKSKYIIIDQLTSNIIQLELSKKFQEQEKIQLEEEGLKEGDEKWDEINDNIDELEIEIEEKKVAIQKIKGPVITLIKVLKILTKDERTDDEIFETFRTKVQEKLEEIIKSSTKEIPNEIVKLFALLGKNINKNIQGTFTTKQNELLEHSEKKGWSSEGIVGKDIDENIYAYFKKILESETQKIEEIIKDNKDKKFIITNGAIVVKNPYRSKTLGCLSTVIDAAEARAGGIEKGQLEETGDMKVIFINRKKTYSYVLEVKREIDKRGNNIIRLIIEIRLPLSKDEDIITIKINKEINMDVRNVKAHLSAPTNYLITLKVLVEKIRAMKLFEWDKLLDDRIFISEFVSSYHVKALGDFIQELNGILKYGGYKYTDSNPIYKDNPNIIQFKKTSKGKEEVGNKLRIYAANDRPSACRYMFLKKVLSEKTKNTKSLGGFYYQQPNDAGIYEYFFI